MRVETTTVTGTETNGVITGSWEEDWDYEEGSGPDFTDAKYWGTFRLRSKE